MLGPVATRDCHVKFEKANACLMVSGSLEAIEMVRFRVECMTGRHRDQLVSQLGFRKIGQVISSHIKSRFGIDLVRIWSIDVHLRPPEPDFCCSTGGFTELRSSVRPEEAAVGSDLG